MAKAYGAARAPFIRLGSGLSRYGNGAMTVRCISCLPALVGAYGKEGGGCFPDTSTGGAFAMEEPAARGPDAEADPDRQHEPARARPERAGRPAHHGALRLPLQPCRGHARTRTRC